MKRRDYLVEVCSRCLRASCWHGEFMCPGSCSAGTVRKLRSELDALKLEHRSYYSVARLTEVTGVAP